MFLGEITDSITSRTAMTHSAGADGHGRTLVLQRLVIIKA
jgi:hypothetical protein